MSEGFWERKEDGGAFSPLPSVTTCTKTNAGSGRALQSLLAEELVRPSLDRPWVRPKHHRHDPSLISACRRWRTWRTSTAEQSRLDQG